MRLSLVRFSDPESQVRTPSWADFIINMFGFSFRYTQPQIDLDLDDADDLTDLLNRLDQESSASAKH